MDKAPRFTLDTRPGAMPGDLLVQLPETERAEVIVMKASGIRPEPVRWLWNGWLARGKVHLLAGAPGTGKTSLALALAATLSVGGRWPDGTRAEVADTLVWSGEDDPADTLVPRLIACGADLGRVAFVAGAIDPGDPRPRGFDLATDVQALTDHIAALESGPALLIADPLVSAVAGDSHKNAEVRRALQPLVDLAATRGCAVLGITHFSKSTAGRDPVVTEHRRVLVEARRAGLAVRHG